MKIASNWAATALVTVLMAIPLPSPEPPRHPSPPAPALPAITLMSMGDSLTLGVDGSVSASYRGEESRLLTATGQPHQWIVAAAGGSKCSYWAERAAGLLATYHPSMLFLDCGTNDTPSDATRDDYLTILAAASAAGVQVVAILLVPPDMKSPTNTVRPYILDWMKGSRDAIKSALDAYPNVIRVQAQRVPANPEWLKPDGIHWDARAEAGIGQLAYQAAAASRGWKTLTQLGQVEMCGLGGSWPDEPWPPLTSYRICRE